MATTITITVTVDGGNVIVSTATGGGTAKSGKAAPPPKAHGALCTTGDIYQPAPGKKGGIIHEMAQRDLEWWRDALTANIADPDKSRFRDKNQDQLDGVETEMHLRATGGAADGGGSAADMGDIPFAPHTLP